MDLRHTLETEGKVEVAKAAHKWEVTRDTIKRDLDRLRWQFDMDIVYDRVSNSYVYDAPKPDALSASEFAALHALVAAVRCRCRGPAPGRAQGADGGTGRGDGGEVFPRRLTWKGANGRVEYETFR